MREIVLDTETTGLDPLRGDRLVEVGCVELINRMPTGQTFHRYMNPEREMAAEAFAVHGLSTEFLASKPFFHEVVDEFLAFIGDAPLVIHNASFDVGFINAELDRIKRPPIPRERRASSSVSTRRSRGIGGRLMRSSSALMKPTSNEALWITSGASPMKARNSSTTSWKKGLLARNSVESPCTANASAAISRSGFI